MNIPNTLTMSRFLLIPLFLAFYFYDYKIAALFIVLLAGLTDVLDGYIARRNGQITLTGMMLDPLADKLMMLAVILALLAGGELSWEAFGIMAFRELGMIVTSAYFHFAGYKTLPANNLGKVTTVVYYLAILLLFLEVQGGIEVLWFGIGLSYVASFVYLVKFRILNRAS